MSDEEVVEMGLEDELTAAFDGAESESDDVDADITAAQAKIEAPEEAALEPYAHWNEENKALFSAQTPEVQKFMLDRQKDMDRNYTEKTSELAEQRKGMESIEQAISPYRGMIQQAGYTDAQATQEALQAYAGFVTDPVGTITRLAKQYGIFDTDGGEEGYYTDPAVLNLQSQLYQLQNSMAQREQLDYQLQSDTVMKTLDSFKSQVTDTGEPAHPYFDAVVVEMTRLAEVERNQGREPDLQKLYDDAVYLNPTVREQYLSAQREATDKAAKAAAREKAEKAKVAGFNVRGGPGGPVPAEEMTIEDSIRSLVG